MSTLYKELVRRIRGKVPDLERACQLFVTSLTLLAGFIVGFLVGLTGIGGRPSG